MSIASWIPVYEFFFICSSIMRRFHAPFLFLPPSWIFLVHISIYLCLRLCFCLPIQWVLCVGIAVDVCVVRFDLERARRVKLDFYLSRTYLSCDWIDISAYYVVLPKSSEQKVFPISLLWFFWQVCVLVWYGFEFCHSHEASHRYELAQYIRLSVLIRPWSLLGFLSFFLGLWCNALQVYVKLQTNWALDLRQVSDGTFVVCANSL